MDHDDPHLAPVAKHAMHLAEPFRRVWQMIQHVQGAMDRGAFVAWLVMYLAAARSSSAFSVDPSLSPAAGDRSAGEDTAGATIQQNRTSDRASAAEPGQRGTSAAKILV
jgi:hypothetical protein